MKKQLLAGVAFMLLLLPLGVVAQIDCTTTTNFDTGVCYTNSTVTEIQADICPDDPSQAVMLTFTAGEVENSWDELEVYEGAMGSGTGGTQVYSGYGSGGDLTGLVVEGSTAGGCLSVYVNADGSGDCPGNGYVTPVFDASCLVLPSCADPSSLVATSITDVSAQLDWTHDVTNCTAEEYWVLPTGSAMPSSGTGTTTGCGSAAAMGLTATTTYDVWVQTDCSTGGLSGIINIGSFTTLATPPPNDDCANAEMYTVATANSCPASLTTSTEGATEGANELPSCDAFGNFGIWYQFTAPASGNLEFESITGAPGIAIFEGADCNSLTEVAGTCLNNTSGSISGLTGGNTYWAMISTDTEQSVVEFCLYSPACTAPTFTVSIDNTACPNIGITVEILTLGSTSSVDITESTGMDMETGVGLGTYTLTGYSTGDGPITVTVADNADPTCNDTAIADIPSGCPPSNDDCENAIPLTVNADYSCSVVESGTNENSTPSPQTDDVTGTPNTDVWYSFVATDTEHRIELLNIVYISGGTFANTDMGMGLYDGTAGCSALVLVADSDPNTLNASGLTVGTTYYLRVYNWSSTVYFNSFDVCVGTAPPPPPPPACDGNFYDSGGATGDYSSNEDIETTICPDLVGDVVTVTFTSFLVEGQNATACYDELFIYDGNSTSATAITPLSLGIGTTTGGFCYQAAGDGTADLTGVAITSTSADGCLTFDFSSDGSVQLAGWETDITCDPPAALPPIANAGGVGLCQNATPEMVDGSSPRVELLVAGEIIAAINSNGQDLGMVDASYVRFDPMDNTTRDYSNAGAGGDGYDLIDRSIVITPTMQPTSPVSVFLYYTDDEYNEIIANTDGDNAATSWADLGITKFPTDVCSDMSDPQNLSGDIVTVLGTTAVTGGWEVEIEVSSFSGFQAHEGTTALPIKLNRFTAKADGRHNMIEWSTASEINVQDHTLMKSSDATNWEILGITDGEVNSNSNIDYDMVDAFPHNITYYQLMTTDLDGSITYSPIVSVARDSDEVSAFLGASPVPTRDVVNLNVYSQTDDNLTIILTDISGKRMMVNNRTITQGNHQLPLDLSDMTNGVYLVTITSDFISQTHRVIKN